jgi:ABC-type nitrate/sulfonate/bicarbonate transport system permease component
MTQGTVRDFDEQERTGSLLMDDRTEVQIDATSVEGSGLRLLRIGQRVRFDLVEEGGRKVARTLRLGPVPTFTSVVVPAVLPAIVTGLRLGFNLTFLGVLLGEMFASRAGLGFLLMSFGAAFEMDRILAVILTVALLALGINALLLGVERRIRGAAPEVRLV